MAGGLAPVFSPSGDSLALAANDGIIRVYESGSGRLKTSLGQGDGQADKTGSLNVPNGHLVEKHTCLVWATSGRKKKKANSWSSLVVVGTASGDVKAFDPHMGELKWRAQGLLEGGVAALSHSSQKPGVVLAAGASGQLVSISMENGETVESFQASKHAITCLAVSPDGAHAFGGGATLALWQIASQEREAKYTGHVVPASCAVFAPSGGAAASASPGERHVALWSTPSAGVSNASNDAKPAKARKGLRPAATTLSMQQPPVQLDTCAMPTEAEEHLANGVGPQGNGTPASHDAGGFCLCAVSEGGDAYVWECGPSEEAGAALQGVLLAQVQVKQQTGSGISDRILAAKLLPGSTSPSLLIARGSAARPVFETVSLPSPDGDPSSRIVTLSPATGGALLPGRGVGGDVGSGVAAEGQGKAGQGKVARRAGPDVTILGPGADVSAAPAMRTAGVAGTAGQMADEVMADAQGREEDDEDDADDAPPDALVPLGERVAAMQLTAGVGGGAAGASDAAAAGADEAAAGPVASDKANSLAVLMTQALRSNDRVLLERCLSSTNIHVITNTVARLLPMDAATFLRAAVDRLLSSPARAGQLAPWVKAVLHHHTGYIMSAPGAQAPLAALYQAIDARVSVYSQLLRLHGRLGLVTAHSRLAAANASGQAPGRPEPEVVFEDEDDEGDEGAKVEDPFALDADDSSEEDGEEGGSEGSEEWGNGGEDSDGGSGLDDDDFEDDE